MLLIKRKELKMLKLVCKIKPKHPTKKYVTRYYYYDPSSGDCMYRYANKQDLHPIINEAARKSMKEFYEKKENLIKIRKKIKRLESLL